MPIESAIKTYTKQTWTNGEVITKEKMDYIENGILGQSDNASYLKDNTVSLTGNTANNRIVATSSDTSDADASSWTSVTPLTSNLTHATIFERISMMFKNIRYLFKIIGNTDISNLGDGTVTDNIEYLHDTKLNITDVVNNLNSTETGFALSANMGRELKSTIDSNLLWKGLLESCDLNTVTTPGVYALTNGNTYTNAPIVDASLIPMPIGNGILEVLNSMDSTLNVYYLVQVAYDYSTAKKFYRTSITNGSSWNSWSRELSEGDIVNNLTTDDSAKSLSAAQGKVLNDSLVSTRSELHRLLGSYGFNSNKYLDIKTSNYNGFYFTMLIIVGTTVATIRVAGTDTPSVTAVGSAPIALLSATTITNGVRINYDASSVRGGIIIFAPYATLEALTIEETSKS